MARLNFWAIGSVLLAFTVVVSSAHAAPKHSGRAGAKRSNAVSEEFRRKDQEIASLKTQIAFLQANIVSLQNRIDKLESPTLQSAAGGASGSASKTEDEPIYISHVTAQRFEHSDSFGDTMWLVTFRITNHTALPVTAPSVYLEFNDQSKEMILPYASSDGYTVEVGKPGTLPPLSTATLKYFWNASDRTKTPLNAIFEMGSSQLTLPVNAKAPRLEAGG